MGKRNDERQTPDVINSQPCGVAGPASLSSRFKRQRFLSDLDEDSLESADQIALTLVRMRFNKLPTLPTQPEKVLVPDCTHVTDDEEDEEEDDADETPMLPPTGASTACPPQACRKLFGPPVMMALPRPPPLPRRTPSPPSPLERRHIRTPYLPEGRPLPPAPVLPSLRMWSTVPPAPAAYRSKE